MKKLILSVILFSSIFNISIAQNCLHFDGLNDVVQTNYSGVLDAADRTFEAWIFIDPNAPFSAPMAIVDYGVNIAGSRNTFSVSGTKQLTFISGGGTNANISSPANSIIPDRWTHVAFVLNNGIGFLYVDGVEVGTGSLTDVDTPADQDLKIGQRVTGGSIPFYGSIDEVRIWSLARTEAEIIGNMNNELCSNDPDLQLYLRFNQGDAYGDNLMITNANDDSGNAYSAALNTFMLSDSTSNWATGIGLTPGFSFSAETIAACNSYTWSADSIIHDTSGNFLIVFPSGNINGCDSILSLDLTINTTTDLITNVTGCDSFTWGINGEVYTSSGTTVETLMSPEGCPYTITLNLSILESSFDTTNIVTCEEYTWSVNNEIYTTSGLYTQTYPAANGCDSMVTLNLNISPPDTSITNDGNLTLTSNDISTNASYQWLDCNNSYAPISGAIAQNYLIASNGSYAVEVTANGCSDTSACVIIDDFTSSIEGLDLFESISLFPNPTKSNTTLLFGKQIPNVKIIVTDVLGRVVSSSSLENVKEATITIEGDAGIYFIQVTDGLKGRAVFRVLKV